MLARLFAFPIGRAERRGISQNATDILVAADVVESSVAIAVCHRAVLSHIGENASDDVGRHRVVSVIKVGFPHAIKSFSVSVRPMRLISLNDIKVTITGRTHMQKTAAGRTESETSSIRAIARTRPKDAWNAIPRDGTGPLPWELLGRK